MHLQIKSRQPLHLTKKSKKYHRWRDMPKICIWNTLKYIESFFRQSGIHGFFYLTKNGLTLMEKCFWLVLLVVSLFFCVQNALQSIDRYNTKNTVVSLERDYYFWRTKTTSITICPMTRLNMTIFDEFCRRHNIIGDRKIEFADFMEKLANSTYMNFDQIPLYNSTDNILDELSVRPRDYMKLIYNLTGDSTLNLKDQYHIRTEVDELLVHTRQVLTEWGLCYMTNTVLDLEFTAKYLIFGEIPQEYIGEHIQSYEVSEATYFENDLIFNIKGFVSGMYLFIHSVYEVMNINRNLGYYGNPASCTIESMPIITEHKFKERTTLTQRKCRFASESNLEHFPIYTKNMCLQECRLNLAYKLCKCIPHFYPNLIKNPKPVCSYRQLRSCFPQHERYLIAIFRADSSDDEQAGGKDDFKCNCMDNCRDANIIITNAFPVYESSALFGSLGVMVNMKRYPTFRLRRQIMFTFTDLLVSIGGTAGLFLGFSVLGAIEILYFFTLRLIWFLRGYRIE